MPFQKYIIRDLRLKIGAMDAFRIPINGVGKIRFNGMDSAIDTSILL